MNDNTSTATPNPKKLFVGNLAWAMTEDDIRELFEPYGEIVEIKLVIDRNSGRSKGIAFVEYVEEDSAQKAIDALHGQEVMGRNIVVNVARPFVPRAQGDRPSYGDRPRSGGGYGNGGGRSSGGYGSGGSSRGGYSRGGGRDYGRDAA